MGILSRNDVQGVVVVVDFVVEYFRWYISVPGHGNETSPRYERSF